MTTTLPTTTRASRTKPANGSSAHRSHHAGQPGNGSSLSNGRMPPLVPLPTASASAASPSPDEIAVRAYQYFEKRGCQHGHDVEHWLAAESSLRAEQQPPQP